MIRVVQRNMKLQLFAFSLIIYLLTSCIAPFATKVDRVCLPKESPNGDRTVCRLISGKYLYIIDGKRVKGPANKCKCLPFDAKISTPKGPVNISSIVVGDSIYTSNVKGDSLITIVSKTNKVKVPDNYRMLIINLEDSRSMQASGSHPIPVLVDESKGIRTYQTRLLNVLRIGDYYDGSKVINIKTINYSGGYTYDILPEGNTGNYWVNDILTSSTLHNYVSIDSDTLLFKIRSSEHNESSGECCRSTKLITIALSSESTKNIKINAINNFDLRDQRIKSNQFKDTLLLKLEFSKNGQIQHYDRSIKLCKSTSGHPSLVETNLLRTNHNADSEDIQWPITLKYEIDQKEYQLTLIKPDELSSIYPP